MVNSGENGHYLGWPGITTQRVKTHLQTTEATTLGHMRQTRKNLRSTRTQRPSATTAAQTDAQPREDPEKRPDKTGYHFAALVAADPLKHTAYSDLTGRFPVTSSRGTKYIFVLYDYDTNVVLVHPLKSREDDEILAAYKATLQRLATRGAKPLLHLLDNEASDALRRCITGEHIEYQMVPPHIHRRNAAERAISTFKDHFVAGLSSVHPNFPMHLWCRMLEHAEITLNLLRASRINPNLSAYAALFGNFNYDRTPLAPPGSKVIAHEKPGQRRSWGAHGVDGWYIGPALNHYRCHRVYLPSTRGERVSDTVEFFPHRGNIPAVTPADAATEAAFDLARALSETETGGPFRVGDHQLDAIRRLAEIFQTTAHAKRKVVPDQTRANTTSPALTRANISSFSSPAAVMDTYPNTRARASVDRPDKPLAAKACEPRVQAGTQAQRAGEPRVRSASTDDSAMAPTQARARQPGRVSLRSSKAGTMQRAKKHYPLRRRMGASFHAATVGLSRRERVALCNNLYNPDTGRKLTYRDLLRGPNGALWEASLANEFGRLMTGIGSRVPNGTGTIIPIPRGAVPPGRKVTYAKNVVAYKPHKAETRRSRLTIGGDKLEYPFDSYTPTVDIGVVKILLNSVLSTRGAKFATVDIKDFYLNTPMERYEYMRFEAKLIPAEVMQQYNLHSLVSDGYVYFEVRKGMYGLEQAGRIANDRLQRHLNKHGYYQDPSTPGLFRHKQNSVSFTL